MRDTPTKQKHINLPERSSWKIKIATPIIQNSSMRSSATSYPPPWKITENSTPVDSLSREERLHGPNDLGNAEGWFQGNKCAREKTMIYFLARAKLFTINTAARMPKAETLQKSEPHMRIEIGASVHPLLKILRIKIKPCAT